MSSKIIEKLNSTIVCAVLLILITWQYLSAEWSLKPCVPNSSTAGIGYVIQLIFMICALILGIVCFVVFKYILRTVDEYLSKRYRFHIHQWAIGIYVGSVLILAFCSFDQSRDSHLEYCRKHEYGVKKSSELIEKVGPQQIDKDTVLKNSSLVEIIDSNQKNTVKTLKNSTLTSLDNQSYKVANVSGGFELRNSSDKLMFAYDMRGYEYLVERSFLLLTTKHGPMLFVLSKLRATSRRSLFSIFLLDGTLLYEEMLTSYNLLVPMGDQSNPVVFVGYQEVNRKGFHDIIVYKIL